MKTSMLFALALVPAAFAAPPVPTSGVPHRIDPVAVATVRHIDGRLVRISDWRPYQGSSSRETGTSVFDAFPADDSCGGKPGSWWFGADAVIPSIAEDMTFASQFGGTTVNTYGTAWAYPGGTPVDTSFGIVVFCYNEMIAAPSCGPGVFPDDFTVTGDGFIANFGPLPPGNWFASIDGLNDLGVLFPDGDSGTYEQIKVWIDDLSGDISVCTGPCGPLLWGTSDDDGTGNRPGANDVQALLGDAEGAYGKCYDMTSGFCPDPFANMAMFMVKAGDGCAADHDRDGFVTGIDYDLFVADFEAGCIDDSPPCTGTADFDGDGFITGIDFDLYVGAFERGCF